MPEQLFVVEHYDESGIPDRVPAIPTEPADVHVVFVVHVRADDVVLALVEGADEATVTQRLAEQGWRVDRITAATWAHSTAAHSTAAHPTAAPPTAAHPTAGAVG